VKLRVPVAGSLAVALTLGALIVITATVPTPPAEAAVNGFTALTPTRLLDTRPGERTIDDLYSGQGSVGPGTALELAILGRGGVPANGVGAIAVNVTSVNASTPSYVTVFPTGQARPLSSNLNTLPGHPVANSTHVPVGSDGTVSLYNALGSTDLIVDVIGWYPTGSAFAAVNPARLLDTRTSEATIDGQFAGDGLIGADQAIELTVVGRGGIPESGVGSVVVNVTATDSSVPSFITVFPTGQRRPLSSNLNNLPNHPVANATHVPVGTDGKITLYNALGSTHLIVDVLGWYPPNAAFTALTPARLLDTRPSELTIDDQFAGGGSIGADQAIELTVLGRGGVPGSGVGSVAVNVTAVHSSRPSFLTVFPTGQPRPRSSTLNNLPDHPVANATHVPVGTDGKITLYNALGTTHLIVDVLGWYPGTVLPSAPLGEHPRIYLPGAQLRLTGLMQANAPTATRFRTYADARMATASQSLFDSDFRMWYFALLGNLTDDPTYCTKAVSGIEWLVSGEEARIASYQSNDPSTRPWVAYDSYLDVGPLIGDVMMVYDWCFSNLSSGQRTRWLAYADQAVWNVWHPDDATWAGRPAPWSGWSIDNPSNNYYYSFLRATMLLGLAADGELASAAGWRTFFRTNKIQDQLLPTFNTQLVGGGSREGTGYGTALMRLWEIYDIWEASTGEDIGSLTGHTRASLLQQLHYIVPTRDAISLNGDHSRDSTAALFDYHRHYGQALAHLLTGDTLAGRAKTLFNSSSVPTMQNGFMVIYDFLYDTSAVPSQPLSDLNTAYYGSGVGQLFARSDWNTTATWLNMTAGPYTESHAHRDQGSFLLYKNGWMAIDPNYFSHSGIRQEEELHNLVRIVDNDGDTVTQREGYSSTVQALHQGNGWLHVAADTTAVYTATDGAPVQRVQRELVFLQPDVVVIFDRVTTSAGTQQRWQLNTPTLPVVNGAGATVTSDSTTMQVERVIPAAAATTTFNWISDGDMSGGYRLDETVAGGTNTFLHVLSFGTAVNSTTRSDSGGRQGVVIDLDDGRQATIRFSTTAVDGTIEILTSGGGTQVSTTLSPGVTALPELAQ
jgi:hypothetical protein